MFETIKRIFNNLFDRKNAKFGFKIDFVDGFLNHNAIKAIHAGKCLLNFENQQIIIKQDNETIIENMIDIYNFFWYKSGNNFRLKINTKTHNEFTFDFGESDILLNAVKNYADAFKIPFETEETEE